MILFLIFVAIGIMSFILIDNNHVSYDAQEICAEVFVIDSVVVIICILLIITAQATANRDIKTNEIKYQTLIKRLEVITSEYEDVSKAEVIKDIGEWNEKVMSTKYRTYNPWTSWFNSKKLADSLEYIEY